MSEQTEQTKQEVSEHSGYDEVYAHLDRVKRILDEWEELEQEVMQRGTGGEECQSHPA